MKLLVSDYDGTLKKSVKELNLNINAINKFIKNGNKFAIATGREFDSISLEVRFFDIDYDYLICNNGLIIFDRYNKIVCANPLLQDNVTFVDNLLQNEINIEDIRYYNFYSSTIIFENILEVYVKFYDEESATIFSNKLKQLKPDIGCYQVGRKLFIGNNLNKATAISYISEKEGITKEKTYTIGDGTNDLEMLKEFNGYKILGCNKKLLFKKIPTIKNVRTLVKKISKK